MAQARQLAFLNKLHKELLGSSSDYRSEVADLRVHTFKLSHPQLLAVTMLELSKRNIKPTKFKTFTIQNQQNIQFGIKN